MTFHYRDRELYCEDVPLAQIAGRIGTPVYVYSAAVLDTHLERFAAAAQAVTSRHLICFAVKANGNPSLLSRIAARSFGADVTSGGELFLARHAGFPPERIVFSGVGKLDHEIEMALDTGIRGLHVESAKELERIRILAAARGTVADVAIRLNPDVAAGGHPHLSTGARGHKFGVAAAEALALARAAAADPHLRLVGLAMHIGSQISALAPWDAALAELIQLARTLAADGIRVGYLDVGGGLAVTYAGEVPPAPEAWLRALGAPVAAQGYELLLEPGRSLVAAAGALITTIHYAKQSGSRRILIADAGMQTLIRPALYNAHHPILPLRETPPAPLERVDLVGPICETGDYLARDRELPPLKSGDRVALLQAGAYGYAMSSNYNGQLRPAEVLVFGADYRVIRKRETYAALLQGTGYQDV